MDSRRRSSSTNRSLRPRSKTPTPSKPDHSRNTRANAHHSPSIRAMHMVALSSSSPSSSLSSSSISSVSSRPRSRSVTSLLTSSPAPHARSSSGFLSPAPVAPLQSLLTSSPAPHARSSSGFLSPAPVAPLQSLLTSSPALHAHSSSGFLSPAPVTRTSFHFPQSSFNSPYQFDTPPASSRTLLASFPSTIVAPQTSNSFSGPDIAPQASAPAPSANFRRRLSLSSPHNGGSLSQSPHRHSLIYPSSPLIFHLNSPSTSVLPIPSPTQSSLPGVFPPAMSQSQ